MESKSDYQFFQSQSVDKSFSRSFLTMNFKSKVIGMIFLLALLLGSSMAETPAVSVNSKRILITYGDIGKAAGDLKEWMKKITGDIKETAGDMKEAAKETAGDIKDVAKETSGDIKESAKRTVGNVKKAAKQTAEDIKEGTKKMAGDIKDMLREDRCCEGCSDTVSKPMPLVLVLVLVHFPCPCPCLCPYQSSCRWRSSAR